MSGPDALPTSPHQRVPARASVKEVRLGSVVWDRAEACTCNACFGSMIRQSAWLASAVGPGYMSGI